jgi:hypothetical protein
MNDGNDNAKFLPQFEQQSQQRNGIDATRNRNPNAVSGTHQFFLTDMAQYALYQ